MKRPELKDYQTKAFHHFDMDAYAKDLNKYIDYLENKHTFPNSITIEKEAEKYGFQGVWPEDYHFHPNCNRSAYTAFKAGFKRCLEIMKKPSKSRYKFGRVLLDKEKLTN